MFFPSGIFVALALRFDVSRGKQPQYFKSAFLGYTFGIGLTIFVMNWFQAAQVTGFVISFFFLLLIFFSWKEVVTVVLLNSLPTSQTGRVCEHVMEFCWSIFSINIFTFLFILPCFQPALLYIVPAVIGFLAAHCIWNGDVKQVCFTSSFFPFLFFSNNVSLFSFFASHLPAPLNYNMLVFCCNHAHKYELPFLWTVSTNVSQFFTCNKTI